MRTSDFDYSLPDSLIANAPADPRDSCRMMVLNRETEEIHHDLFLHIEEYLNEGDVLVLNDTKVIPCRITFDIDGKSVEIFITKVLADNLVLALVRPGKVFRKGCKIKVASDVMAVVNDIFDDGQRKIEFESILSVPEIIRKYGSAPFPPYIKDVKVVFEEYQTIYAKNAGSLAAPTAGLHFTDRLLSKLKSKGIGIEYVTLHVGLGTFLPVKESLIHKHKMHSEEYVLDSCVVSRLNDAKKSGRKIIAVGTTAVRVLESSCTDGEFVAGSGETDIFIYPGYKWKCVDGLITNFHLPKSTLLMLVSSFAGREFVLSAYEEAIRKRYRFYSFGDAMLIL